MENSTTVSEHIDLTTNKTTSIEIAFGALMGVAAIAGLWGATSLLISLLIG